MATRTISNAGGNWNSTATWVEGVIPGSSDDVYATATSGQLTVSASASARSLDLTGYSNTLTLNATLTLGSSTARPDFVGLKLSPTMGQAGSSALFCSGSYTDFVTIDTGGLTLNPLRLTFSLTGKWKFISAFTSTISNGITQSGGYLDFNNQNVSLNQMNSSGSGVRTLAMGTGSVSIAALSFGGTGLTFIGAPNITITSWLQNSYPGLVFGDLTFTGPGVRVCQGTLTCRNLTRIGTSAANDSFWLGVLGDTVTVTDTLTVTDNSGTGLWMGPGTIGGTAPNTGPGVTIALGATGKAILSGVDCTDVTFTGVNTPVTGSRLGDGLGNAGITFDAARTLYWVGGAGNWSDSAHWSLTSGGVGGQPCPKPQDDLNFDNGSFTANSQTATLNYNRIGCNLVFNVTNRTGCNWGASIGHLFGSYATSNTPASSTGVTFRGRGSHTLRAFTSGGSIVNSLAVIDASTGTYTIVSDLQLGGSSNSLTLLSGTLRCDTYTLKTSLGFVGDTGARARTFDLGTGVFQSVQSSVVFGTVASGFTLSGTGTLLSTVNGSYTLKTNGQVVPKLTVQTTGSYQLVDDLAAGTIAHTGGTFDLNGRTMVCDSFTSSGATTRTLLTGAATVTVNGNLVLSGTGLTLTPGTSTVTVNGQTGNTTVAGNGLTFNSLTLTPKVDAGSRITVDPSGLTAATFTVSANNAVHGSVVLNGNVTTTTSFTATGQAGNPVYIYGPDWGGQATVASPTPTLSNVTFNRINATGGSWTGTGVTFIDNAWKQAVVIAG